MIRRYDGFGTLDRRQANREVAARWHWIGTQPLVDVVGSLFVVFDGLTVTLKVRRRFV